MKLTRAQRDLLLDLLVNESVRQEQDWPGWADKPDKRRIRTLTLLIRMIRGDK